MNEKALYLLALAICNFLKDPNVQACLNADGDPLAQGSVVQEVQRLLAETFAQEKER